MQNACRSAYRTRLAPMLPRLRFHTRPQPLDHLCLCRHFCRRRVLRARCHPRRRPHRQGVWTMTRAARPWWRQASATTTSTTCTCTAGSRATSARHVHGELPPPSLPHSRAALQPLGGCPPLLSSLPAVIPADVSLTPSPPPYFYLFPPTDARDSRSRLELSRLRHHTRTLKCIESYASAFSALNGSGRS